MKAFWSSGRWGEQSSQHSRIVKMRSADLHTFDPPPFEPHPFCRGGHLQTIMSIGTRAEPVLHPNQHVIPVSDGDSIVLHEDRPQDWRPENGSILMFHGLSGSHQSTYMIRLANRFTEAGLSVYRVDMRSAGVAAGLSRNISHSGRSDDVIAAIDFVSRRTDDGPMMAMGVSLGGHQLLRAVCQLGGDIDPTPKWMDRLVRVAAVAPPTNLPRCAANMSRLSRRPYNRYFIRNLMENVSPLLAERPEFKEFVAGPKPRTLIELDERLTAPLSGFASAQDYYEQCSVHEIVDRNMVPTLILAAADDPIVPIENFRNTEANWPQTTTIYVTATGGHVGFIDTQRKSWMDRAIMKWFVG